MIQPPNAVSFLTLLVRPARPFVCLKGRICELSNPSFHVKCTDHRRKKREKEREARQSNMQLLYKLVHELSSSTCAAQLCVIATTVCLSLLILLSFRLVSLFLHGLFVLFVFLQPQAQWNPLTITLYPERGASEHAASHRTIFAS